VRALAVTVLGTLVLAAAGASADSPGGRIVFTRLVGQQRELFKVRPDGTGFVRLTRNGMFDEDPEWSPDGRRLLARANGGLVLRSPDGRLRRRLSAAGFEGFDAHWSPDGRLIGYLVGRCRDPNEKLDDACADLWVIRPDGSGRRRLAAEAVDLTLVGRPYAWAPDGRRLVYVPAGGRGGLVIVGVRDGRKRALGVTRSASSDPSWSPDGRWIAFSRQRGPFQGSDLYAVAPDGTRLRRLARGRDISRATWAPDGRRIAYFSATAPSRGDGRFAVVVADANGRHARRLAVATDDSVLLWSTDSSHVLWSTFFERLTIARADGSRRPALVTTGETPDWG
jgi:Tol biopolymer transport system component